MAALAAPPYQHCEDQDTRISGRPDERIRAEAVAALSMQSSLECREEWSEKFVIRTGMQV